MKTKIVNIWDWSWPHKALTPFTFALYKDGSERNNGLASAFICLNSFNEIFFPKKDQICWNILLKIAASI